MRKKTVKTSNCLFLQFPKVNYWSLLQVHFEANPFNYRFTILGVKQMRNILRILKKIQRLIITKKPEKQTGFRTKFFQN